MKRHTIFRIILLIYILCVGWLCFSPVQDLSQIPLKILGFERDKIAHFLMFAPCPFLSFFSIRNCRMGIGKTFLVLVLMYLSACIFAAVTEYVQGFLPYRVRDINDLKADLIGLIFGSVVTFLVAVLGSQKK